METKYHIVDYMDLDYYWKSRESKDKFSNNTCHLCFKIEDQKLRYDILKLLIEEKCGDVNKPNNLGYLPHEVMHDQSILNIPESLSQHFLMTQQECLEADYMIISTQNADSGKGKKDIIIDQLDQLGLQEGTDYVVYVQEKNEKTNLCDVLISIKI